MERDQDTQKYTQIEQEKTVEITKENTLASGNNNVAGEGVRNEVDSASTPKETTKKIFFIGIALLILFLLAFAIVRILPTIISSIAGAGSGLSSVFSNEEKVNVELTPKTVSSGEAFNLSWRHTSPSAKGRYTFTYECGPNVYLEHTYPNGNTEKVVCDTPFILPTRESSLLFTAFLTEQNSFADVPVFVNFIEEGSEEPTLTGEGTLTIQNGNSLPSAATSTPARPGTTTSSLRPTAPAPTRPATTSTTNNNGGFNIGDYGWGSPTNNRPTTPTTPKPTTPSTGGSNPTQPTAPVATTKADLVAQNAVVGVISSTNVFTLTTKVTPGSRVAVQFEVVNKGGQASGTWKLSAVLPTQPAETVQSQPQTSLRAGDKMIFTLTFDNLINKSDNSVVVHLDPSHAISESNENNNTLFIPIKQDSGTTSSKPDLSVSIIDSDTNGNDAEILFKVENRGASFTQNWVFKVDLPFEDTFTSNSQSGMNVGETREFTVRVDNVTGNIDDDVTITVDATNKVNESNESNNKDSISVNF